MIVWLASTTAATRPDWFGAQASRLTPSEQARLATLARPERRRQFVAAHVAMRRLVAHHCRRPVDAIDIDVLADGRPVVRTDPSRAHGAAVRVSAAHSGSHVAVACDEAAVGVDIERWRARLGAARIERWCRHEAAFKAGDAEAPTWSATTSDFALAVAGRAPPLVVRRHDLDANALMPVPWNVDWRGRLPADDKA